MAIEWKQIAFIENSAAQSVLGNPTGSPAVASAITVAEQTLVGRITGGNVDDLSVEQVKTLIGSSTTSATGVIELATQTEVLAGTDTSRAVVPVDLAAKVAIDVNPKAPSQGINMTYAASASSGIQVADNDNIDFGTGNFTLVWEGMIPDYTPAADTILMQKTDGTNGWVLQVDTTGVLQVILNTTTYSSTVNPALIDTTAHKITAVVTRETASVAGSVVFYVDGIICGASVAITAGAPTTVNNAVSLYVMGTSAKRSAGLCYFASVFNRALSAAEVLDLYRNGINFADKWGSQTAIYTSDFSVHADGWAGARGTIAGNIDGISGEDNTLRYYASNENLSHYFYLSGLLIPYINKKVRLTLSYYLPSANTNLNELRIGTTNCPVLTTKDAWTLASFEFTPTTGNESLVLAYKSGASVFVGAGVDTDDLVYIKNVIVTEIGATLALEPEGIQPAPGQWLDSSTNKLHAWQPVAGSSLTRKKTEFEIRGINTWTASHAAQSIAMTSDASRVMLPPNCYIESIVGVVAGADIEDIIIGDGSDTDRWVELTTGLAAGTVSFMLANRISDGTNYELVVDPDADSTMTITWTIKGYILD